jgi:dienelactone hydrolase
MVRDLVGLFANTGRYYGRSWRRFLASQPDELPITPPTVALAGNVLRDEIILLGLRARRPLGDAHVAERIICETQAAVELYGSHGWLDNPEAFFTPPPPLTQLSIHYMRRRRHSHERITFDSGYEPHTDDPGRDRWLSYHAIERGYALMLRHDEPRPWLVCVHGTEMGRAPIDFTLFHAWHLHEDLGLNLILPVLPMHGPRARGLPKTAVYPSEDVLDDVHATTQAVWDIRRVLSWIRRQHPGSPIGLNGMSLGGYITALVASLEDDLACAILGVPVADLIDVLTRHAGLRRDDPRLQTIAQARPIGRMISPLSLTPRVPMHGRFIYAGLADRVVHPREQTIRLWEHWGRPAIKWYPGGHIGFFRSRPVQQFIDDALVQAGLADGSP